jgi:hypothetical protein
MKRKNIAVIVFVGIFLCVLVTLTMAAQDKYTVKVPNGLSFSEFRGYESWQGRCFAANFLGRRCGHTGGQRSRCR